MSFKSFLIVTLCAYASGFTPLLSQKWTGGNKATKVDKEIALSDTDDWASRAQAAYTQAEFITKTFGPNSVEARHAWEVVEEVELPSSAIVADMPNPLDVECDWESSEKCLDIYNTLSNLDKIAKETAASNVPFNYQSRFAVVEGLEKYSLETHDKKVPIKPEGLRAYQTAKAEAELASSKFGPNAPETRVAWESVFEIIAASDDAIEFTGTSMKSSDYRKALDLLNAASHNA